MNQRDPVAGCAFEKALIAGRAGCSRVCRYTIGERIELYCDSKPDAARCAKLIGWIRRNSRFVFGESKLPRVLTHGRELRLQCGGLQGLADLVGDGEDAAECGDVSVLLRLAEARYPHFDGLPLDRILPRVAAFTPRRKRRP